MVTISSKIGPAAVGVPSASARTMYRPKRFDLARVACRLARIVEDLGVDPVQHLEHVLVARVGAMPPWSRSGAATGPGTRRPSGRCPGWSYASYPSSAKCLSGRFTDPGPSGQVLERHGFPVERAHRRSGPIGWPVVILPAGPAG